ncbi:MAG: ChaN family lipoprotein [Bacteroidales bacterium]|nr:ChaN family lipoprotein [Bacteroidales bacterium]
MKMNHHVMAALLLLLTPTFLTAQKPAYTLFNQKGKETKYQKMTDACKDADVVLFGELHNNPIAHWLQYELTRDLYSSLGVNLVLGAEMFEADGQLIMDEYFAGMIDTKKFEDEMRLWNNYKTDYKPLLEFARDSGLRFVATNIPRRYASIVHKMGADTLHSLSDLAKTYMMPLPLLYDTTKQAYSSLAAGGPMGGHGSAGLRDAQAIKDATMAHFILKNLEPGETFLHYNGAYHSDKFESIGYFLQKASPGLRIITISTVEQPFVQKLEDKNSGKADFIITVPETMTKTY